MIKFGIGGILFRLGVISLSLGISNGQVLEEKPKVDAPKKGENEVDPAVRLVDEYKKFNLDEIEKTVKAFLTSKTVTERLKYVRDPEFVQPLMIKFYGGEEIEAEGFETLHRTRASYQDSFLTANVSTEDFLTFPIAVERLEGKKDTYRVDWESWVGYCESSVEELKKKNPTEPVLVRALVSADSYFNYFFEDDTKWRSYRLAFRNSDDVLSGYTRKNSKVEKRLSKLVRKNYKAPLVLQIAYPPKAENESQVIIMEVVDQGWILEVEKEEAGKKEKAAK